MGGASVPLEGRQCRHFGNEMTHLLFIVIVVLVILFFTQLLCQLSINLVLINVLYLQSIQYHKAADGMPVCGSRLVCSRGQLMQAARWSKHSLHASTFIMSLIP